MVTGWSIFEPSVFGRVRCFSGSPSLSRYDLPRRHQSEQSRCDAMRCMQPGWHKISRFGIFQGPTWCELIQHNLNISHHTPSWCKMICAMIQGKHLQLFTWDLGCVWGAKGTYTNVRGQTGCEVCSFGSYQSDEGQTGCGWAAPGPWWWLAMTHNSLRSWRWWLLKCVKMLWIKLEKASISCGVMICVKMEYPKIIQMPLFIIVNAKSGLINPSRLINHHCPFFCHLKTGGPPRLINTLAYPRLIKHQCWNSFFF